MENIEEIIQEFCKYHNCHYIDDYSGRYMYGEKCVAMVCDNPLNDLAKLIAYIVDRVGEKGIGEEVVETLGKIEYDNMGMKFVVYFRGLTTD